MVEPTHVGLFTIPESLSHIISGHRIKPVKPKTTEDNTANMQIIGGHKKLSSFLHLSSGTQKYEGRIAFSPYTGSLTDDDTTRDFRGAGSLDLETPTSTLPAAMGIGASITLNMRYVAKDMWRKVTFPPGITVTQARDLCMLRFNIWQQIMNCNENADLAFVTTSDGGPETQHRPSIDDPNNISRQTQSLGHKAGATAGLYGVVGSGSQASQSHNQFREQFGLFWTSAGHWLEADEMLNKYPLRKGEVLELQHIVDFIPLQPHEFRFSYAETAIYYLRTDGPNSSWQLHWAVLHCRVLRLYRKKGQQEADVEIDLTHPYRLTDQDGRSWPRSSSKGNDLLNIQSLQECLPATPQGAASGGFLVIQLLATAGSQHMYVFRSGNLFDYDVWHRTLRHTLSAEANSNMVPGGSGGSISGASNKNHSMAHLVHPSDTSVAGTAMLGRSTSVSGGDGSAGAQLAILQAIANGVVDKNSKQYASAQSSSVLLSPQLSQRLTVLPTRHEGYVNRKSPDGYGFRRRFCVLNSTTLYGFLHANDCRDLAEDQLEGSCDFAIALDHKSVSVEAIAWNGRYLLRIFGPDSNCIRDRPGATALQPDGQVRIQCTDILATAAQAAIEQYGSTFGMLPDSCELARLMVDDHDEGQMWAVSLNSIAGLKITSQSRVIVGARRPHLFKDARLHATPKTNGEDEFHTLTGSKHQELTLEDCEVSSNATALSSPEVCRQQSLCEFFIKTDPMPGHQLQQPASVAHKQLSMSPPQHHLHQMMQPPQSPTSDHDSSKSLAPKWIPLDVDKYVKEEEERKRHHNVSGKDTTPTLPASVHSTHSFGRGLRSKASNVSDNDHTSHSSIGSNSGAGGGSSGGQNHSSSQSYSATSTSGAGRQPPRFNWFKRRGSTSKQQQN
ncbi:hypothetical protein LPJ66_001856 [Kickxella alabastrina]|uniref:Uncharacterized protein n=1 Tax=Kickxella alabastrina TaxID=61397 RepID=A0ACC1IS30_9FUNG|nr:hypothetical protein LPJ66_001856 [Kickxella alabastrina]